MKYKYDVEYQLTDKQCNDIQDLFEKKNAYENLIKIIDVNNKTLYDKLMSDYAVTLREFNNWWKVNIEENKWEGTDLVVDFAEKRVLGKLQPNEAMA